jgi:voltage-gated potassium channel
MNHQDTSAPSPRHTMYLFLEGSWPWGRVFSIFILTLVLINLLLMIVTTVDTIYIPHRLAFDIVESITVGIFTLEYLLRLYASVEKGKFGRLGMFVGRLRWMVTFMSIVDLLAIV